MDAPPNPARRRFLRRAGRVAAGVALGLPAYGFWEARQIRVRRQAVPMPNLPPAWEGKTVAVLGDFHHGPFVGIDFIRAAVEVANGLKPDLFALVGDFNHKGPMADERLPACVNVCAKLRAPLGVFAVPGNHDMHSGGRVYRRAVADAPLTDLTNRAERLTVGGAPLWLAGVDDHWWGKPDQATALAGIPDGAPVILLSHNPDHAEARPDARVGLVLSGHTHGGQIAVSGDGGRWVPSKYGEKYRAGLVRGPASRVFVTRGLGEAGVPVRFNCPPEINVLTLVREGRA